MRQKLRAPPTRAFSLGGGLDHTEKSTGQSLGTLTPLPYGALQIWVDLAIKLELKTHFAAVSLASELKL